MPARNSKGYKSIVTDVKAAATSIMKVVVTIVLKTIVYSYELS